MGILLWSKRSCTIITLRLQYTYTLSRTGEIQINSSCWFGNELSLIFKNLWIPIPFHSVGVYGWDFVQHLAFLCSPSCKVEVLFTVSDYPDPIKKISWLICIGTYGGHRTRVRSFIEVCPEYRLTLPQLPYVPNLSTYVLLFDSTGLVSSPSPYSEQAKYIYNWDCCKWYLLIHCLPLMKRSLTKAILIVGGFGMTTLSSLLCESYLSWLPHS